VFFWWFLALFYVIIKKLIKTKIFIMNKLDNPKLVAKLDPAGALKSIDLLGEQVSQVWREFKKVKLPKSYKKINSIVINGMGGSALGAHILGELFFDQLKVPFKVINSYLLPAAVDEKTLYIICSYSGSTEEPLLAFSEAQKRGAKIFGIAAGKNLGQLIKRGKMPGYIFCYLFYSQFSIAQAVVV